MEWFPLSVFYLLYFMETLDAWDQVTHRTNFKWFCTICTHYGYVRTASMTKKNPILFWHSLVSCLLSWTTHAMCMVVCVSKSGARLQTSNGIDGTMNFHCCCCCGFNTKGLDGYQYSPSATNPGSICSLVASERNRHFPLTLINGAGTNIIQWLKFGRTQIQLCSMCEIMLKN